MNKSRPSYRECENCGLHVTESTLAVLAESAVREGNYQSDMTVSCPNCYTNMTPRYTKIPNSADVFNPYSREGISEDTVREMREVIFSGKKLQA